MAIKDLVTLGIGCSPGSIKYLLLVGLDIGAVIDVVDLTLTDAAVSSLALSDAVAAGLVIDDAAIASLTVSDVTRS